MTEALISTINSWRDIFITKEDIYANSHHNTFFLNRGLNA